MATVSSFGERLAETIDARGRLCVGIDPHSHLLERWGLADDANGARTFGLLVVDAVVGRAGIVKPQAAFFERFGSAGYAALEDVLAAARAAGLLVIADVKRGDVGTSVDAYARAWLTPGGPLESDAITVSAYQGVGSIAASADFARRNGKGMFVLAATSNPEAEELQTARLARGAHGGMTVAAGIVAEVRQLNRVVGSHDDPGSSRDATVSSAEGIAMADIGLVIGATVRLRDYGIDPGSLAATPAMPILAPGFGHQGARLDDVGELFGAAASCVVANASRSILEAGRDGIGDAVSAHADALAGHPTRATR